MGQCQRRLACDVQMKLPICIFFFDKNWYAICFCMYVQLHNSDRNVISPEVSVTVHVTRSCAVAKRPRDASCLYSFNTKRRAQSFYYQFFWLQIYHYVQLNSFLFSSPYSSMLQAVTNKHSRVRRRLCDLYTAWSSVTVFVTSQFARPAINWCVPRGQLCDILSFVIGKCFWHVACPAIFDSQQLDRNCDLCLYPTCIRRPRYGGSRRNIATPFGMGKLEWCGCPMVKKFRRYVIRFDMIHEHDRRTPHDGYSHAYAQHRTAKMMLMYVSAVIQCLKKVTFFVAYNVLFTVNYC